MRDAFFKWRRSGKIKDERDIEYYSGIAEKVKWFKNPYAVLVDMLSEPDITVQGNVYTRDEALRICTLSRNDVQRKKLKVGQDKKNRGTFLTDAGLQELESKLPEETHTVCRCNDRLLK